MGRLHPGQDPPPPPSVLPERAVEEPGAGDTGPGALVLSCEAIAGDRVLNRAGEALGKLAHVMIEVPSGRIAYAVLAYGGVFGIGEKLFAVPWALLDADAQRRCFVLDIRRARLEEAAGFDKDHWPSMADPEWREAVRRFFAPAGPGRADVQ